jgi:hypothetical protein
MRDLENNVLAVKTIDPVVANDTTEGTGTAVDIAGYEGAMFLVHVGQSGDSLSGSVKWTISYQESDASGSGFTDVAAAELTGGTNGTVIDAAAEDEVVIQRGYLGSKRYLRVLCTADGTHTYGTPLSAVIVKGFPRHAPAV